MNKYLTPHFTFDELKCKCGCGTCLMNQGFLDALEELRSMWKPMIITSGYRCNNYNVSIKGAKNSQHTKGKAVDVHLVDSEDRFRFVELAFRLGFTGIGIDKAFIHIDNRSTGQRMWCY